MKKEILTLERISEIVRPIASKNNIQEIYIFGSYARGEATKESDFYQNIMKERLLVA